MSPQAKKLATSAIRIAALTQLGPLAGGLLLASGAVAARVLAEGHWAEISADMLMHLASDKASELFGSAAAGLRNGHNGDIEKSLRKAAIEALARLKSTAPTGYDDWFKSWNSFLTLRKPAEIFAGIRDLDPLALTTDDEDFSAAWWRQMEPVLAAWADAGESSFTQLHLNARIPAELANYLREHLLHALEESHREVLREPELHKSWIAFQQDFYEEALHHFRAIRQQLNRIEGKLDRALENHRAAPPGPL